MPRRARRGAGSATMPHAVLHADRRALLADREHLGDGADRDRTGLLAGEARRRADRAGDARERSLADAALDQPPPELRALRRRADEADVREVVALERPLDDREVE